VVVLRLEAQVALDVDFDLGQRPVQVLADLVDVLFYQEKLAIGFCRYKGV